jgi:hypothetical protein
VVRDQGCAQRAKSWLGNYRRKLSTTEDTEDRRFKPEKKYVASVSPVSSVVASCNSATRFKIKGSDDEC